jgi:hypothetical protein
LSFNGLISIMQRLIFNGFMVVLGKGWGLGGALL